MKNKERFGYAVVTALVLSVALGWNPACSALALAIVFSHHLVEKYFTATIHDETAKKLVELRADFVKVKAKQDQADLKSAFGGRSV